MTYEIHLANHKPDVLHIEADEIGFDPHWVSFRVKEPQGPLPSVHCEACGEPTGVARVRPAPKPPTTVALFPASQVRRVTRIENV